jgi:ribonuclease HI
MLFDQNPISTEKIPATTRDPALHDKLPFVISIVEDHPSSIEEAENVDEDLVIYSDGSALEGKVGAAAVCYAHGNLINTIHYYLGLDTEHMVHEAELVGMLLGLHLATNASTMHKKIAIGADNQAALQMLQSDLRSPSQHLACEILRTANKTRKKKGKKNLSIIFRWTAGHEGITGNELADTEAKKAAKGLTSDKPSLPPYLQCQLLINPSSDRHR